MSFQYSRGVSANNKRKSNNRLGDQERFFQSAKYSQDSFPKSLPPPKKTKTVSFTVKDKTVSFTAKEKEKVQKVPVIAEKEEQKEVEKPSVADGAHENEKEKEGDQSIEKADAKDPGPIEVEENKEDPQKSDGNQEEPATETAKLPGTSDAKQPKVGEEGSSTGVGQQPAHTEHKTDSGSSGNEVQQ